MVGAAEPEQRENEKNKRLQRTRQHMSTFANFFFTKIAPKKRRPNRAVGTMGANAPPDI